MKTTLNAIKKCVTDAKKSNLDKLLKGLNKTEADDEPLDLLTILEINGLDYALWCLRTVDGYDKELRLFAVSNAKRVRHLIPSRKLKKFDKVLDDATRYAIGEATKEELDSARASARVSARAFAEDAAWASARASALVSARASAEDTAWYSTRALASNSSWASASASALVSARAFAKDEVLNSAWDSMEQHFRTFLEENK